MKLPLQIALGLIIAAAVIGTFRLAIIAAAFKAVEVEVKEMTNAMQARAEEQRRTQRAETERKRLAEERRLQQIALQNEQDRQRKRYIEERRAAFDAQYVAPESCESPASSKALVECANHKIRAREAFFARYGRAVKVL